MKNTTRVLFAAYVSQIALLSQIALAADAIQTPMFTVEPTVQQKLEERQQESSAFLNAINVVPVDEQSGEALGMGIGSTIAGRTDTSGSGRRQTQDPTGLVKDDYFCKQTDFDTHLSYAKLDAWAKFANFQTVIRDVILKRQALDRIMIGWNGVQAAADTDRQAFPLLQDVNIGWLQKIRTRAPSRHMAEVVQGSGKVRIGRGGDYQNLDSAVFDAVTLLDPWHQDDSELVVILGRGLLHDKYFPLVDKTEAPTEKLAADVIISQKRVGGLRAVTVPHFPPDAFLITRLDNLSLYYQDGKRRRHLKDVPEANRIENYESSNDAYVVEDFGCCAFVENIEFDDFTPQDDNEDDNQGG